MCNHITDKCQQEENATIIKIVQYAVFKILKVVKSESNNIMKYVSLTWK